MADRAPRLTSPSDFNPLDEAVYEPGTPTHAWTGRELSKNLRWLDTHLGRRLGEAYGQNVDNLTTPTIRNSGGEIIGPFTHWGTPGVRDGEWYIRMALAAGEDALVCPFVLRSDRLALPPHQGRYDGSLAEFTATGAAGGVAANYGPIATPLAEGPCRVGLLVVPPMAAANDDTGTVSWADGRTMCSTLGDFAALVAPLPMIRLYDASGPLTQWTQILDVHQTILAGDTVVTQDPLTPRGIVYGSTKAAISWATRYAETITVLSVYLKEDRA
jgi:hypothetical protein